LPCMLVLLLAACQRSDEANSAGDELPEGVLALVEGEAITVKDFELELGRRAAGLPGSEDSPETRRRVLEALIQRKSLLVRARAEGFVDDPEMAAMVETLVATRYREQLLTGSEDPVVRPDEVEARYEAHADRYRQPAAVRAQVLWIDTSARATPAKQAEQRARAESLRARAVDADAADFRELVRRFSDDPSTRYVGGDTGWLVSGEARPARLAEIESAALDLPAPGAVAPLLELPGGFAIVRLLDRRESAPRPIAEVREAIAYDLLREKRHAEQQALRDQIRDGLEIRTDPERLLEIPESPSPAITRGPPALPGG